MKTSIKMVLFITIFALVITVQPVRADQSKPGAFAHVHADLICDATGQSVGTLIAVLEENGMTYSVRLKVFIWGTVPSDDYYVVVALGLPDDTWCQKDSFVLRTNPGGAGKLECRDEVTLTGRPTIMRCAIRCRTNNADSGDVPLAFK